MARTFAALAAAAREQQPPEPLDALLLPERWTPYTRVPELQKALGAIQLTVGEVRRLLTLPDEDAPLRTDEVRLMLRDLLDRRPKDLRIGTAWDLVGSLKALLPMLADHAYVSDLLEIEAVQAERGVSNSWVEIFSLEELTRLREEYRRGKPDLTTHTNAVHRLSLLYSFRSVVDQKRRAEASEKCRFLNLAAPTLLYLLLAFVFVANEVGPDDQWRRLALAATAGALGGQLGSFIRLRDKPIDFEDLRLFWPMARLQPLVGAIAGVIVFIVLESGFATSVLGAEVVAGDSRPWNGDALLAFIAGFSEPFFLGIVQRIAGLALDSPAKE